MKFVKMNPPLCICGCDGFVSMFRGKWRKYLPWHHTRTSEARNKISRSQMGSGNSIWNGGRTISGGGYVMILCKDHPYADVNGRVREERLMMEKFLGRYLTPDETVHHENEIKDDNRFENFELMTRYGHRVFHIKKNRIWEYHRKNDQSNIS